MQHGTINGYAYHKCRCEDCRQARRTYFQEKKYEDKFRKQNPFYQQTRLYGITEATILTMLVLQDSKCKICDKDFGSKRDLQIDHDHQTGKIRGLLCFNYNLGLGCFGDDYVKMFAAASYLKENI